jgi:hypothetical protein
VLVDGHPVKELANGEVNIPFGEYTLRFRNKNNRRAMVKFTIDGEDASGSGYVIPANDYIDIERWSNKPVKFKFVALDSEDATDFGKNGPNPDKVKGTIEAHFYLEKESKTPPVKIVEHHHHHYRRERRSINPPSWPKPPYQWPEVWCNTDSNTKNATLGTYNGDPTGKLTGRATNLTSYNADNCITNELSSAVAYGSCADVLRSAEKAIQEGCTVEGSTSNQAFKTVSFEAETDCVTLRLFLKGYDSSKPVVVKPVNNPQKDLLERLKEQQAILIKAVKEKEEKDRVQKEIDRITKENEELRKQLGIS